MYSRSNSWQRNILVMIYTNEEYVINFFVVLREKAAFL